MAAPVHRERMSVAIDDEVIIILLGSRINTWWKIWDWLPAIRGMNRMVKELQANPDSGLLGVQLYAKPPNFLAVQYWKSFALLEDYAKSRDHAHLPAWQWYNSKGAKSGAVGLWHETYRVRKGDYECIYNNMPPYGLACAGKLLPFRQIGDSARSRLNVKSPSPSRYRRNGFGAD